MARHLAHAQDFEEVRERVLNVFSVLTKEDPYWLIGVRRPDGDEEGDLILRLDIGEFPIMLCTTHRELMRFVHDPDYTDYLFLLIERELPDHRIKDKSIQFFLRERRIKSSHTVF